MPPIDPLNLPAHDALESAARKRAGMKLGWQIHACAYLLANLGLSLLSWHQGLHWAIYPALGWGLGLLAHGLAVLWLPGSGHFDRMVARERSRLQAQQTRSMPE